MHYLIQSFYAKGENMMGLTGPGRFFKMTLKTRLFLWLYRQFGSLSQWFINNCDFDDRDTSVIWEELRTSASTVRYK